MEEETRAVSFSSSVLPDKDRVQVLLSNYLQCSVCQELYTDPRILSCGHTFCATCIDQNLPLNEEEGTTTCYHCRTVSALPVGGARGLPPAEDVNTMMEVYRPGSEIQDTTQDQDHTARDQDQQDVQTQLVSVQQKLDSVSESLVKLNEQKERADMQGASMKMAITSFVQDVKDTLEKAEAQQIEQVNGIIKRATDKIKDEIQHAELQYAQLKTCSDYIKHQLQGPSHLPHHNHEGVMKILSGITEIVKTDEVELAHPDITAMFHQHNELMEICTNIGKISEGHSEDTPTAAVSESSTTCVLGKEAQILLRLQNEHPGFLACQAIGNDSLIQCQVEEQERRGEYSIMFKPTQTGIYHFKLQKDVHCNKATVTVCKALQRSFTINECLSGPTGICLSPQGNLLIVNDRDGTTLRNMAGNIEAHCQEVAHSIRRGRRTALLGGVAATPDDHILVIDNEKQNIKRYSINGIAATCPAEIYGRGLYDIVVKRNGCVYISYTDEHLVKVFNPDLSFSHSIGEFGNGMNQFNTPLGIACDSNENLYVCDSGNSRILKFSSTDEEQVDEISCSTMACNFTPRWMAIDSNDMLYVTGASDIVVFDNKGRFFESNSLENLGLEGVAVDKQGRVYICCSTTNQILVYNEPNTST